MPNCQLCGEPMPEGEEMFKYHGFSGDCPKPPLPQPKVKSIIEYVHRDVDGQFLLSIIVDRHLTRSIGFDTPEERQRAHDDLLGMMRQVGAQDLPNRPQ